MTTERKDSHPPLRALGMLAWAAVAVTVGASFVFERSAALAIVATIAAVVVGFWLATASIRGYVPLIAIGASIAGGPFLGPSVALAVVWVLTLVSIVSWVVWKWSALESHDSGPG